MDLNPYTLFFGCLFGLVGYLAWRYGRRTQSERHLFLAVLLMAFPYFVSNVWLLMLIGAALTTFLFFP